MLNISTGWVFRHMRFEYKLSGIKSSIANLVLVLLDDLEITTMLLCLQIYSPSFFNLLCGPRSRIASCSLASDCVLSMISTTEYQDYGKKNRCIHSFEIFIIWMIQTEYITSNFVIVLYLSNFICYCSNLIPNMLILEGSIFGR